MSHIPGEIPAITVAVILSLNVWFSLFFFFTLTSSFLLVFSLCYPQIQIHILNVLTKISISTSVPFNDVSLRPSVITCIFHSGYSFRNVVVHLSSITSNWDISVITTRLRAGPPGRNSSNNSSHSPSKGIVLHFMGAQIPGAESSWRLNFVRRYLIVVDPQNGTGFMSHFLHQEFWGGF